ncbi:MAG: sigma-54-dependent transcriptional regulator [Sandaracinaceae bacterium]
MGPVSQPRRVTLVDDDPVIRRIMRLWLEHAGYQVVEHGRGKSILDGEKTRGVVCLDLGLGDIPGMEVLTRLLARDPDLPVVVVTAERTVETAVSAMRTGAYDFVTKPLDQERLLLAVDRAVERRELLERVSSLETELSTHKASRKLVGESAPMQRLATHIDRVLRSDVAVAIFGESGTGKELVARAIHDNGHRREGPFVPVNCAAIPEALQESELFGHERGSFTGATGQHRGRFEQAEGGTLFLDEVGEMTPATQAALLRTLQERTIRRVGGSGDVAVDVRILCATHRDLESEVSAGRFRADLFYRLVVFPLTVPPLRQRAEDIPALVRHFMDELGVDVGRTPSRVAPEAFEALMAHNWPGNVRELRNVIHRALLACEEDCLRLTHLPRTIRETALTALPSDPAPAAGPVIPLVPLRDLERMAVRRALEHSRGNVSEAARLLGIGRATIYRRLAEMEVHAAE